MTATRPIGWWPVSDAVCVGLDRRNNVRMQYL
jgi:hypothetical protein